MMLDEIRKRLYRFDTWCKNRQTLREVDGYIEAGTDLLLVHQMGRAASMTITKSLRAAGVSQPVLHTHWLNPDSVAYRVAHLRRRGLSETRFPLNVRMSQQLSRALTACPNGRHWRLVSVVRDPIARNISVFFLSIEDFLPNFHSRYAEGAISHDEIVEVFLDRFPHYQPLLWFDREVRDVFGIDVFRAPPLGDSGYAVYEGKAADLLIIKVEQLAICFREAFREFLGLDVPMLLDVHVTERDAKFYMYREFLEAARLPASYVERMYDSAYARHFYSDADRERFRRRWLKENDHVAGVVTGEREDL